MCVSSVASVVSDSESEVSSVMSNSILYGTMDYRPPGSSVFGISGMKISGMKSERREYWNELPCPPPGDQETKERVNKLEDLSEEITNNDTNR